MTPDASAESCAFPADGAFRPDLADHAVLDLSDNDYLRLSHHPHLIRASQRATGLYGAGAGSSRLVSGSSGAHLALEQRFAEFKGAQAGLVFPTGYMANFAAVTSLAQHGDLIVMDKLNHASLIDAGRLASATGAVFRTFPHRRYDRLHDLIASHFTSATEPDAQCLIVTDGVFSMDGDLADLAVLAQIRDAFGAVLIVDEAHATGIMGDRGQGMDAHHAADVTVSTASKGLGSLGGVITSSREVIDWIINTGRSFVYTTAIPAGQVAAIGAALDVIETEPQRRERLGAIIAQVRGELRNLNWIVSDDPTPIIPLIAGEPTEALRLREHLASFGVRVPAIRPPTVAPGTSRVRLSLNSEMTDRDISRVVGALSQWNRTTGA